MHHDAEGKNSNDEERKDISQRKKGCKDDFGNKEIVVFALITLAPIVVLRPIRHQDRDVYREHQTPNGSHHENSFGTSTVGRCTLVVDDGEEAYHGNQYKRVDSHIGSNIDKVVHQFTENISKWPSF